MTPIENYLKRLERRLHHLDAPERHSVLAEVRSHLHEEARRLHAQGLEPRAAEGRAIEGFGDAEELAVAYGPEGGEVRSPTGVLLRIARTTGRAAAATGRGAGQAAKVLGLVALALLAMALIVFLALLGFAGTAMVTFQDEIREAVPRPLYGYSESWETTSPNTDLRTEGFDVGPEMKEFRITVDTAPETGCARITLVSPSGERHEATGNGCSEASYATTLTEQGRWTVEFGYLAYSGSVEIEAWGFERAD